MKIVADTMIWVSYCIRKDGFCHRVIERARRQRVRFLVSDYILNELSETLLEDLKESRRFAGIARKKLCRIARIIDIPEVIPSFLPADPKDNAIIQTALSGRVDYLVTLDTEILKLGKFQDVEIITPAQLNHRLGPEE